jgi:hypothetical protein
MKTNEKHMKIIENNWKSQKSMKTIQNQWEPMKFNQNQWKSMRTNENHWTSLKINKNNLNPWKPMRINENQWSARLAGEPVRGHAAPRSRPRAPPQMRAQKRKSLKPLQAILSESYKNFKCFKRFEINMCARTGGQIKKAPGRKKLKPLQATRRTQISTQFMKTGRVFQAIRKTIACTNGKLKKRTHQETTNTCYPLAVSLALSLSLSLSRFALALLSLCSRSLVMEHSIITSTFDNFDLHVLRVRNIFVGLLRPHVQSRKHNIRVASRFIDRWRSHLQLPALRTANPIPRRNFPRPSIEVSLGENDFGEGTETSTSSELGWHPSNIAETARAPTARLITHSLPKNLKTGGTRIVWGTVRWVRQLSTPRIHIFESMRIIKYIVGGI